VPRRDRRPVPYRRAGHPSPPPSGLAPGDAPNRPETALMRYPVLAFFTAVIAR